MLSGKAAVKAGIKRHRNTRQNDPALAQMGITKPAIKRLARRGGVKRIDHCIYDQMRGILSQYLDSTMRYAIQYCRHSRRKTVTRADIVMAVLKSGKRIYGFDDNN